jgi:hypothetical protein
MRNLLSEFVERSTPEQLRAELEKGSIFQLYSR